MNREQRRAAAKAKKKRQPVLPKQGHQPSFQEVHKGKFFYSRQGKSRR